MSGSPDIQFAGELRDDVEFGEAGIVGVVHLDEMGDGVAAIVRRIGGDRLLDPVQGDRTVRSPQAWTWMSSSARRQLPISSPHGGREGGFAPRLRLVRVGFDKPGGVTLG